MKMQFRFNSLLTLPVVALGTGILLLIPFIAMQFTPEVNWSAFDFVIMGILLFGSGSLLVLVLRQSNNVIFRTGVLIAAGTTFLMIWANFAVGLIGSGPNAGNLMYAGVLAVLFAGVYLSRFKAWGLENTMYATAVALVIHTLIALAAGMQHYSGSSLTEIISVNLFFMVPYLLAGLFFRYVDIRQTSRPK